jgi:hypothetical protein
VARALNFEFLFQGERAVAEQEYGAVEMQIRKMAEQVHEIFKEAASCFGNARVERLKRCTLREKFEQIEFSFYSYTAAK